MQLPEDRPEISVQEDYTVNITARDIELAKEKLSKMASPIQVRQLETPTPEGLKGAITHLECRADEMTDLKYKN